MTTEREEYSKTSRSTLNRLKQRGTYDAETIHSILDSATVLHVSFLPTSPEDDPFPTILPMLGAVGSYTPPSASEKSAQAVYLHGHISSRFFKLPNSNLPEDQGWPSGSIPVCIAATHVDGLVLALTPFNHSMNYRSAVIHGWASLVSDPEEKAYALEIITDAIVPKRWENSRVPPTEAENKATGVLKVQIVSASAKIRAYGVGNDKEDLENPSVMNRVWTGVVPVWTRYGEPISAPENIVGSVPEYLAGFVGEKNKEGEEYAKRVAVQLKK